MSSSTGSAVIESPFMSREVMSPSGPKTSATSCFIAPRSARVATAISRGGTPPRSLTRIASGERAPVSA